MKYPKIISMSLSGRFFLSGITNPENLLIIGTVVYEQNNTEKDGSLLISANTLSYYATDGHITPENRDLIDIYDLSMDEVKNLLDDDASSVIH